MALGLLSFEKRLVKLKSDLCFSLNLGKQLALLLVLELLDPSLLHIRLPSAHPPTIWTSCNTTCLMWLIFVSRDPVSDPGTGEVF